MDKNTLIQADMLPQILRAGVEFTLYCGHMYAQGLQGELHPCSRYVINTVTRGTDPLKLSHPQSLGILLDYSRSTVV